MDLILGNLRKMKAQLAEPVEYALIIGKEQIELKNLIGKNLLLHHTGLIHCIQCDRKIKKSFQQGYCFPCMQRINECGNCVIHPERCLVEKKACPKDDWAHQQCHQSHIIYLANSSGLKVGITRHTQVPTRWIDQGAMQALPIFQVENRYQSGLLEVIFKKHTADKTNWRKMLTQTPEKLDLHAERARLLGEAQADLALLQEKYNSQIQLIEDADTVEIQYPLTAYPTKVSSLSLDKTPEIRSRLTGIKGQYLIFEQGVLNIRKFGGYEIEFSYE